MNVPGVNVRPPSYTIDNSLETSIHLESINYNGDTRAWWPIGENYDGYHLLTSGFANVRYFISSAKVKTVFVVLYEFGYA